MAKKASVKKSAVTKKASTKKKASVKKKAPPTSASSTTNNFGESDLTAPRSPTHFRVRIRMYRHGLGDCFLITFPGKKATTFNMLIDCGALGRDKSIMKQMVHRALSRSSIFKILSL